VNLTPVSVPNGNLVLLEIDLAHRDILTESLAITHSGRAIPLSRHPTKTMGAYFALIGISYYATRGVTDLILEWTDRFGQHIQTIPIDITDGQYRSERITVAPRMVSPSQKDIERIKAERSELRAIYTDSLEARTWETPFDDPMVSDITSPFGSRRMFNGKMKSYHSGVDYRAPIGTPVYAANAGTVKLAKSLFFSGNLVLIDHGLGLFTQYAHLSEIRVVPGQRVEKGEQIGLSGVTGRVNGPHLHWGVKLNGVNIDPLQLLEVSRILFRPANSEPAFIGDIVPDIQPSN
jgi:murein DD-endopeptidase MepM/ murein hydrolase activator NlpD